MNLNNNNNNSNTTGVGFTDTRLFHTRKILSELNASIAPSERRLQALYDILQDFDHYDELQHDEELGESADIILFQKLAFCLSLDKSSEEIGLICTCLEMIYTRGSRNGVAESYNEVGAGGVAFPLIMEILKRPSSVDEKKDGYNEEEVLRLQHQQKQQQQQQQQDQQGEYVDFDQNEYPTSHQHHHNTNVPENNGLRSSFMRNIQQVNEEITPEEPTADEPVDTVETAATVSPQATDDDNNDNSNKQKQYNSNDDNIGGIPLPYSGVSSRSLDVSKGEGKENRQDEVIQKNNDETSELSEVNLEDEENLDQTNDDELEVGFDRRKRRGGETDQNNVDPEDDNMNAVGEVTFASYANVDAEMEYEYEQRKQYEIHQQKIQNKKRVNQTSNNNNMSRPEYHHHHQEEKNMYHEDNIAAAAAATNDNIPPSHHNIPPNINIIAPHSTSPSDLAINKMLKVLRCFSRVLNAMIPLCHYPNLIGSLLYQFERSSVQSNGDGNNTQGVEARVDTIAILVNLACAQDNKSFLLNYPNLLDTIIQLGQFDDIPKVREHASIVLMNLGYHDQNKINMIRNPKVLSALSMFMMDTDSGHTRRYAAASLLSLISSDAHPDSDSIRLCVYHENGEMLESLRYVIENDSMKEARISAGEAFYVMVTQSPSKDILIKIASFPHLLDTLGQAVLSDYDADVRAFCAKTLESLANHIHSSPPRHHNHDAGANTDCHTLLLNALVKASQWTKASAIANAIQIQSLHPQNLRPMCLFPGMLDSLGQLAQLKSVQDMEVRSFAICAIERLTTLPQNRQLMAQNALVITALTKAKFNATAGGQFEEEDISVNTVKMITSALKNLAQYI